MCILTGMPKSRETLPGCRDYNCILYECGTGIKAGDVDSEKWREVTRSGFGRLFLFLHGICGRLFL